MRLTCDYVKCKLKLVLSKHCKNWWLVNDGYLRFRFWIKSCELRKSVSNQIESKVMPRNQILKNPNQIQKWFKSQFKSNRDSILPITETSWAPRAHCYETRTLCALLRSAVASCYTLWSWIVRSSPSSMVSCCVAAWQTRRIRLVSAWNSLPSVIVKWKYVASFNHTLRTIDLSTFLNSAFLVSLSNCCVVLLLIICVIMTYYYWHMTY